MEGFLECLLHPVPDVRSEGRIPASHLAKAQATDTTVVQHAYALLHELCAVLEPMLAYDGFVVETYVGDSDASLPRGPSML